MLNKFLFFSGPPGSIFFHPSNKKSIKSGLTDSNFSSGVGLHISIMMFILTGLDRGVNLKNVCSELGEISGKRFKIGIQLGISHSKLKEFEREDDPLSAIVNFWLRGNVEGVPVSWKSIVEALKSKHVGETGLASTISKKYCQEEERRKIKGMCDRCIMDCSVVASYIHINFRGYNPNWWDSGSGGGQSI